MHKGGGVRRSVRGGSIGGANCDWTFYIGLGILILSIVIVVYLLMGKPVERFSDKKTNMSSMHHQQLEYFYMPSCPHCKDFNPVWDELEKTVSNENVAVRMQKHDIMDDEDLAKKYNVNAAPTILLIKEDESAKEYKGPRNVKAIMSFLKDEL